MSSRAAFLAMLMLALTLALPVSARAKLPDCSLFRVGTQVVLYGTSDDPDVFIWDSREHMFEYSKAPFDQAQELLMHALLAPPGTRAKVTFCAPYHPARDPEPPYKVVGIVITTGALRGDAGWVRSIDIAVMHRSELHGHLFQAFLSASTQPVSR